MNPQRVAFFDLDGTLTDPKAGICGCAQYAMTELGLPAPPQDELEWMIGPPLIESMQKLVGPGQAVEAVRLYRERFGVVGLYENEVYDGVRDLLQGLRDDGWRLFVATSKLETYAIRIVGHFGLAPYFERVYGADLDGSRQHKDALLAHALADSGVDATMAAMIGDRSFDVIGARANGMPTIGAVWGYGSMEELREAGAAALAHAPGDVTGALAAIVR